ncbi:MAG: hypothetical protein PHW64_04225 [Sulfuricurvum sp.]|nr:hypothetical protein [Sulfuricurvum sp.]
MKTKIMGIGASVTLLTILSGCGGGSSSSSSSALQTGSVVDSNISGLEYACRKLDGSLDTNGTTDSGGRFQYNIGSNCTFKVGDLVIGNVVMSQANKIITPIDMMKATDMNDTNVTNLALFFQSLDEDGNASNGIQLAHAKLLFAGASSFDFASADENTTFSMVQGRFSGAKKVTAIEAREHFQATLTNLGLLGIPGGGSGGSTESNLTCDTSKFASGANVATPTSMDWLSFAGTYIADEGSYDDNFNFTASKQIMVSLSATGGLLYTGSTPTPTTSACVETLSGGSKQMVLHTTKGHLDFGSDKTSISGVSPVDGTTIVKTHATSTGGNTGGNTGGSGVTFPNGTIVSSTSTVTYTALQSNANGKIITFTGTNGATVKIYDYVDYISVGMGEAGYSIVTKADYNGCAISSAPNITAYYPSCTDVGVNFNRTAGTISFTNAQMKSVVGSCSGSCQANGSLSFTGY